MSGTTKIALIVAAMFLLPIVAVAAGMAGAASAFVGSDTTPTNDPISCTTVGVTHAALAGYQSDQIANAATIVAIGKHMGIPAQGWTVAVTAALTESGLRNLDYGDRDSLGLFQQRPSQGWGTPAEITTPSHAATQFYRHLLAIPGWQHLSVNDAAQAVQRSGFPDAYAPHERSAREIVTAVGSGNSLAIPEDLQQSASTCIRAESRDMAPSARR